jgi:hypothetical protein
MSAWGMGNLASKTGLWVVRLLMVFRPPLNGAGNLCTWEEVLAGCRGLLRDAAEVEGELRRFSDDEALDGDDVRRFM